MRVNEETVKAELAFNEDLWNWFLRFASEDELKDIVVHLSDLHAAAVPLRETIDRLSRIDPDDREAVRKALVDIDTQLYEHLAAHIEKLRSPLRALIGRLYEGE